MTDFTFTTVPTSLPVTPLMRAWQNAVRLGFHQTEATEQVYERWGTDVVADGYRLDAAYATPPAGVALDFGDQPVATFASGPKTINVGHGRVEPALFISDVTVRTTHRRQGLLRRQMTDALTRAKADGLATATLTASEGSIYGRFGFGVSTFHHAIELDSGPRLAWTRTAAPRVALIPARDSQPIRDAVFARFHAATRGSHERPHFYGPMMTGAWDYDTDAGRRDLRVAVHWDAGGRPDGIATYVVSEDDAKARVWEVLVTDPEAELALWQFLGAVDLVSTLVCKHFNPNSPVRWALADPRVLKTTQIADFTWARILDPVAALAARGWDADGDATLEVLDPMGLASGAVHVAARGGLAEVTPAPSADVRVDVRALGSLYFGLADARRLAAAGLIEGPAAQVEGLAALFRTDQAPYDLAAF